ncbi:hypothetical protein ACHFCA_05425 [Delftia tsuruhatensis]
MVNLFYISPWPLVVADGWINPVGCLSEISAETVLSAIRNAAPGKTGGDYFGDGRAAMRIVDLLVEQGFVK